MPQAKYLRIDLLEPISGDVMMEPDEAMKELRDYLLNEFDNHGIQAVLTLVDEPAPIEAIGWRKRQIGGQQ
jgi:hypothetical protein